MKVFYGVQGTGNGHLSRARAMNRQFQQLGIKPDYLFSGRERGKYFDMDEFGDWDCRSGFTIYSENGRVNTLKTATKNNVFRLIQDIRTLDLSAYDLVLADFEPITAWSAKLQGVPCITIGHQYAFYHQVPVEGDDFISRTIMKYFAPGAEQLGLHWHHFDQPILPPIVDLEDLELPPQLGHILVYLGFENPDHVIPLLQQFPETQFVYYGEFKAKEQRGNVSLRPLSATEFKPDLKASDGVICNAGFELASEALHLGKRLLVKPLQGQMEQLSNARALCDLGLGHRMEKLSATAIGDWITNAPSPHCDYPDVAKAIAEWLLDAERVSVPELSKQLWQQATVQSRQPSQTVEKVAQSA